MQQKDVSDGSPRKKRKRGKRGSRGRGKKQTFPIPELLGPDTVVEQLGRELQVKDSEPHWEAQRRPPRMSDFSLEVRALREGWLKHAPESSMAAVCNTILKAMVDEKSPPMVKLRAAQLAKSILIDKPHESLKDEAVIVMKSKELGEYAPVFEQSTSAEQGEGGEQAILKLIDSAETVEEVKVIQSLILRMRDGA